ncbi:ATP-binding protein [Pedobacter sp. L105]|uniref:ATP-binding protein n=1 Tax=Pedobacter sp. L105 TaxID=1641871 RepID=UPI00131E9F60|nr:ATP-binding protein [Pedobacter sp. L105]
MNSAVRKTPIIRYALIVSLIVILFTTAFSLYLYYRKTERVRYNVDQMILARESTAMIDSCLINLYSADNSSRLYTLTADDKYFNQFANEIKFVDRAINRLDDNNRSALKEIKVNHLIVEKTRQTENYTKLKLLSDSLLTSAGRINIVVEKRKQPLTARIRSRVSTEVKIDTVKSVIKPAPKKKFFGRIFAAFSSKKSDSLHRSELERKKSPTVVEKHIITRVETVPAVPAVASSYQKNYQQLLKVNNDLKLAEQEMLKINNRLITQIIAGLNQHKLTEQIQINTRKSELNNGLQDVVFKFRRLSSLIFLFLLAMVLIILYNVWKIFRNEQHIISYGENAEQYALSKSAFLASMSHEIRTPLNSVIGFSEQLSQSPLNESQKEQMNAISSSSKLLLEVVNEILDFSKFETGKMNFDPVPFLVYATLEEVCNSLSPQAEKKGIQLEMELNLDKGLCLSGDCFRLKQVVLNLLSNAVKFTAKGKVKLTASVTAGEDGFKVLHVQVRDSGIGITKENIPLVFSEFAQVASAQQVSSQKGTGLGLAISKKIVELQGGTISVSSELGKGSLFSFHLPFEISDEDSCRKNEQADHTLLHHDLNGKHILIAEDNSLNILLLTTILKKWKITFDTASDGKEAYLLFENNNYDLVLSDVEMPEMNGVELSMLIRLYHEREKADIPILALTANVLKEDRDKYLQAGMNGVVLKPFSEKNLLDNITAVLKSRTVC